MSDKMTADHAAIGQPGPEHASLARFEGTWRSVVKIWMDPAADPMASTGTMKNTMVLGGKFLEQVYEDDAGMFSGRGFWGYNTTDGRYEGFWIDSMATFFHIEHGEHDAGRDVYTMAGQMTCPQTGQPMKKRSVISFKGPDANSMEMYFTGADGQEKKAMEIQYVRDE